jgi:predicted nucleic acid-binding protein
MTGPNFLDTNVLAYTDDKRSPEKRAIALDLVRKCHKYRDGVVSTQVLQEYFVTVTGKFRLPIEIARRKTKLFSRFGLVVIRPEDILAAIDLRRVHQFSFWDALVIRAALRSDCSFLYSEDLQHGRRINGLEIVNPFR